MAVFDHGGFATRQRSYSGRHLNDWNDGYNDGYQAARDRYISTNGTKIKGITKEDAEGNNTRQDIRLSR